MNEVTGAECARDERGDLLPSRRRDSDMVADLHEDLRMAHRHERKLAEVRVCREIFQSVQLFEPSSQFLMERESQKYEPAVRGGDTPRTHRACRRLHGAGDRHEYIFRACGARDPWTYPNYRSLLKSDAQ